MHANVSLKMEKSISVLIIRIMTTGMVSGDSYLCTYETSSSNIYLYWYQQHPNQAPQYLLYKGYKGARANSVDHISNHLYESTTSQTSTTLMIKQFSAVDSCGDGIFSNSLEEDVIHGGSVKVSCNYTVSGGGSVLWYHQYPTSAPQFLLLISVYSASAETIVTAEPPYPRLSVNIDKVAKRVDLKIYSTDGTDSALYYYALRPTVTGNPETLQIPSCNKVLLKLADPAWSGCMLLWYNITLFICLFLCICSFYLYTLLLYVVKIYLSLFSGCRAEESVTQPTDYVIAVERQPTKLSCTFATTDQLPYLFWYKQQANGKPMFMLRKDTVGVGETAAEFKERFHARLNVTAKSVPLMIQRVQMSDSAVYYCALKPTCSGDHVQQQSGGVIATEGGLVTLSCQYNTTDTNAYLYWYKQEANDVPKHMLSCYSFGSGDNAAGFKERFDASLNAKTQSVPLTIQRVQLSDSAVYYCALKPTVTTGYTAPLQKHGGSHGNDITPTTDKVFGLEGVVIKLSYPRLSVKLNDERTCVDLEISSAEVADSALYYYALEPHNGQTIEPTREEVYVPAGSNITLSCTYSSAVSLQWYLQDPGSAPQYILLILHGVGFPSRAPDLDPRLSVKLNDEKNRVDLEISSDKVQDSAMYYCVLMPTVKGNLQT
ncbi:unnamed protein product, partial [Coregonus sp. 'balchen']